MSEGREGRFQAQVRADHSHPYAGWTAAWRDRGTDENENEDEDEQRPPEPHDAAAAHDRNARLLRAEAAEAADATRRQRLEKAAAAESAAARLARDAADQRDHAAAVAAAQQWERDRTGAQHSNDGAASPGWIKPGSAADAQRVAELANRKAEGWQAAAERAEESARSAADPLDRLDHENHAAYARKREEKERDAAEEFARRAEAEAEREAADRAKNQPPVPPVPPPSTTSGASVSTSIGDVKASIGAANEHANNAIQVLASAIAELEAWRSALVAATAGSPQADVSHTLAAINRAIDHAREGQKVISSGAQMAEDVRSRL